MTFKNVLCQKAPYQFNFQAADIHLIKSIRQNFLSENLDTKKTHWTSKEPFKTVFSIGGLYFLLTCTFICICKIFSQGMLLCKIFEEFNNAKIKLSWKSLALWCIIKVVQFKICTKSRYKGKALASGDFFKWANTATTVVRPFQNPCIYNWGPYRAIVWFQAEIYWIVQTSCSVKIYLLQMKYFHQNISLKNGKMGMTWEN